MTLNRGMPMFDCDFWCLCGSQIGLKVSLAIVQSQTGAEVTCHHCGQRYRVTQEGAQPLGVNGSDLQSENGLLGARITLGPDDPPATPKGI